MPNSGTIDARKVRWFDGDVITEQHFRLLENWVEHLVGMVGRQAKLFGLVRDATNEAEYNASASVRVVSHNRGRLRIDIEKIRFIDRLGKPLLLDEFRSMELQLPSALSQTMSRYLIFLSPMLAAGKSGSEANDLQTGVQFVDQQFSASTKDESRSGLAVCAVYVENDQARIDSSFVPRSVFLDSSTIVLERHRAFAERFQRWLDLVTRYACQGRREGSEPWNWARQACRIGHDARGSLVNSELRTDIFLSALQRFADSLKAELLLSASLFEHASLKQKAADVAASLQAQRLTVSESDTELTGHFAAAGAVMSHISDFFSLLPDAPRSERELVVADARISREAAVNKVTVSFAETAVFTRGKSIISIYLREFANGEPSSFNVRVGLGPVIYAQLLILENALARMDGDAHSYRIECPLEVVLQDRASQLSVFLPPPLGEGVANLATHIRVFVRE
jgi:hypothetical protein